MDRNRPNTGIIASAAEFLFRPAQLRRESWHQRGAFLKPGRGLRCPVALFVSQANVAPRQLLLIPVATVLLAAAGLKVHQFAIAAFVTGFTGSQLFLIAQIAFELLLGLWLLSGAYALQARWAAMVCFVAFATVSIAKISAGKTSCGCFGNLEVSPWWSLSLNVAAVTALMRFIPKAHGARIETRPRVDLSWRPLQRARPSGSRPRWR